jgi:16S rRNA (cytosine1402-N4)-methyltransferase
MPTTTPAPNRSGYDVIFADLGVSSMQVDDPSRGFSYKHPGPLDMRMDRSRQRTAADVLAVISEQDLSAALTQLGDEPDAVRIARAIVEQRSREPIHHTHELVHLILQAKGYSPRQRRSELAQRGGSRGGAGRVLHPAARTFQALRILVNDELGSLAQLLRIAPYCLAAGGRIGIITFHSGEDRLVERALREGVVSGLYQESADEPVRPSAQERHDNPRSRSARLRWAQRAVTGHAHG